jgi:4-diphosphocytidyl-2-C-methyl-D-erythritol kinase
MTVDQDDAFDATEVAAPAKVNLALLVGPVRPDGFHEIASLMAPVTLGDLVTVRRTPGEDLSVDCAVCPGEQNLAARMVRELEERLGRRFEVAVEVRKQIPVGAGLAGGSSDAAATLVALERLFDLDLSPRLRYDVAAAVGSDVPFFLWPGPQLAMGRGQVLKDVELAAPLNLVIAVPEASLSTATVYGWRDEDVRVTLPDFVPRARMLSSRVAAAHTLHDIAELVENDLEASVVARRPDVGALRDRLLAEGAVTAAMTGSGTAVFGLFADVEAASRARARLLAPPCDGAPDAGGGLTPGRVFCVTDLQAAPEPGRRGDAAGFAGGGHGPRTSAGPYAPGGPRASAPSGAPRRRPRTARRRPSGRPPAAP